MESKTELKLATVPVLIAGFVKAFVDPDPTVRLAAVIVVGVVAVGYTIARNYKKAAEAGNGSRP